MHLWGVEAFTFYSVQPLIGAKFNFLNGKSPTRLFHLDEYFGDSPADIFIYRFECIKS